MRPLLVIGTRPEAIKLAPLLAECRRRGDIFARVCNTGQHRDLLAPVLEYFQVEADDCLDVMRPGQSLASLTARVLEGLDGILTRHRPDCVVAQGDTTSVLATSMAAFYHRIPLVHVEAGLRTGDLHAPFPEEFNRRVAGLTARLHCAPTPAAAENLLAAGADPATVHITGNTVIDALHETLARERGRADHWQAHHAAWQGRRMVLVTCHRRENQGQGLEEVCRAVDTLAQRFSDVAFVWPVHANPVVQGTVQILLAGRANIFLIPPATYPEFVWLMDQSVLILTDSGGVQEEAPSLGKPVLVLRETTERGEAIACGAAELVGNSCSRIVSRVTQLLGDRSAPARLTGPHNPFGDGRASRRIIDLMLGRLPAASRGRLAA